MTFHVTYHRTLCSLRTKFLQLWHKNKRHFENKRKIKLFGMYGIWDDRVNYKLCQESSTVKQISD